MIPIDFEINLSKVKVTETVSMLVYRQNLVCMITRHGLTQVCQIWQTCVLECR